MIRGGGNYSSPDTVSAQTLDVQNDAEAGSSAANPIIVPLKADGTPDGESGNGWEYSSSMLCLKKDNSYYAFDPKTPVTCVVILGPSYSEAASSVHIVKGVFRQLVVFPDNSDVNTCGTIDGGLYDCTVSISGKAKITGGIFSSFSNLTSYASTYHSVTANNCKITAGNDSYTNEFSGSEIYTVDPAAHTYTVSIKYNGDITKLGGWNVTIGNDSSKKLSDLTNYAINSTNGSNIPTQFTFTMPDADVTLTPLVSADLTIGEDGKPSASLLDSDGKADYTNWSYDGDALTLKSGDFAFDSKTVIKCPISLESDATLNGGTFTEQFTNNGPKDHVKGGIFLKEPVNVPASYEYGGKTTVTLDSTDYTVNGVQLVSSTFYFCATDKKQTIDVVRTGPDADTIKYWQIDEGLNSGVVGSGETFYGYNGVENLAATVAENPTVLQISAVRSNSINDIKLQTTSKKPAVKSELKASLKSNDDSNIVFELDPDANNIKIPYTPGGYTLITTPDHDKCDIRYNWNDADSICGIGGYKLSVHFTETDEHTDASQEYYFDIVGPTYSITVEGSGRARYQYGSSTPVGDTKVEKDTYIVLESTIDPDAEYHFLRWSFDKTEDITFTSETGAELSADEVNLTKDTIYFKMPARDVKVTVVTDEPAPIPADGDSTGSDDSAGFIVAGTLLGGTAYLVGTHVWLNSLYGMVPTNRQQLALALWEKADKPAPASTALFEDISADDADAQAAARWCTEQGLLKDYGGAAFKPGRYVFRVQALKVWYALQKLNG